MDTTENDIVELDENTLEKISGYQNWLSYIKHNPVAFVEKMIGLKLPLHQKMLLRCMCTVDDIKVRLLKRRMR